METTQRTLACFIRCYLCDWLLEMTVSISPESKQEARSHPVLRTDPTSQQVRSVALRAVPEIILGGPHFFFRPLHPQDTQGVRAPRPPGHVSALINPPHYGSNMPWPPGQVTPPPPPPLGHIVNKTPSPPPDKKVFAPPPPRIISGTALSSAECVP